MPGVSLANTDDTVIGKVARLQSSAVAMQNAFPRTLEVGSEIMLGDVISTSNNARLLIELSDGGEITLGESTIFVVFEYVMSLDGNNAVMRLLQGAFLATTGKLMESANASFIIDTEQATIGIRGTTVWGGPLDHALEVLMLDGKGVYVETSQGRVELTNPGHGTSIASEADVPSPAKTWGQAKAARAITTVSFD
jgi:hypothetical protein